MLAGINEIYAAKSKKTVYIDLRKEKLDSETMKKFILGPTGNLRAPTIRIGKKLMVGFNEESYKKVFRL
ncbi:MAG: hypothetical protein DRP46_11970 [Candidatus Zixiibacteriota bacterium]|nr:MAG: hypothetical protein DRP46_11970 [candidate division Zixibacteria bacterium]